MANVVERISPIQSPRAGSLHTSLSSIGKKYAVAVSGLAMIGFLIMHLIGNWTILFGEEVFNHYAEVLGGNPLLIPIELILLGIFVVHALLAVILTLGNRKATPRKPSVQATRGKSTLACRTMIISGLIMAAFIIIHVIQMKFGHLYKLFGMDPHITLGGWVKQTLSQPLVASFYVVALVCVGFHVSHALWSSLQTLGLDSKRWHDRLFTFSRFFGLVLAAGFITIVIWALAR